MRNKNTYQAKIDKSTCTGCETCINRCHMNAISITNDIATVDKNFCIGCGLCVVTCPSLSIRLQKKRNFKKPPKSMARLHFKFIKAKFGRWRVFKEIVKLISTLKLYYLIKK